MAEGRRRRRDSFCSKIGFTESDGYTSSDEEDTDYKMYNKGGKVRKIAGRKTNKFDYVSTAKHSWSSKLTDLKFKFDSGHNTSGNTSMTSAGTSDESTGGESTDESVVLLPGSALGSVLRGSIQSVVEIEEDGIQRYSETVDYYLSLVFSSKRTPMVGTPHYKKILRSMAMDHLIDCLKQGQINEGFKKQEKKGTESNEDKSPDKSGPEIFKVPIIDRKQVKWTVSKTGIYAGFSSPPIDPKDTTFLHPAINCLEPKKPSEPFLLFGIDVRCIELKDIFNFEGLNEAFMEEVDIKDAQILSHLEKLYEEWKETNLQTVPPENSNFLQNVIEAVRHFKERNDNVDDKKKLVKLILENRNAQGLWDLLEEWTCAEKPIHDLEAHLSDFVRSILLLDGRTTTNLPKRLDIFRKTQISKGAICVPDITYRPLVPKNELYTRYFEVPTVPSHAIVGELKLVTFMKEQMKNIKEEDTETVILRPELLWQIFEQLLATLMESTTTHVKQVLFQGGLLIVGGKVRTIVLAMCNEVYMELKKLIDVKEMLKYIKDSEDSWCKIYVERSEHTVWDLITQAKMCYYNFSQ